MPVIPDHFPPAASTLDPNFMMHLLPFLLILSFSSALDAALVCDHPESWWILNLNHIRNSEANGKKGSQAQRNEEFADSLSPLFPLLQLCTRFLPLFTDAHT
jgi:hypothetical protein